MSINWNLGLAPDVGGMFMQGLERGRAQKREADTRNAMAEYARNPNEQGLNALADYNPEFVVQQKQSMAQSQEKSQRDAVAQGMKMIGEAAQWADTPEKWDRAIDYLAQYQPDVAKYRGQFSPDLRMAAISAAGQYSDYAKAQEPVNMAPGNRLVNPQSGAIIAEAPFAPRQVTVKDGETVMEYQPGSSAGGSFFDRILKAEGGTDKSGNFLTSPAGAIGPAQVMPGTAPEAARLAGLPFDNARYRSDPEYNKALGQAYLNKQLQDFGGNEALAAAAYNAGPGRVRQALQRGGQGGWLRHVPAETQAYVQKVTGGGSRVIAQGAPKQSQQWKQLNPQEAQQRGLDPSGVWQVSPEGEIKPVQGTIPKATGRQVQAVRQKLNALKPIENQIARVEKAMEAAESDGWTGIVGGRVPGGWDAESNTFDKSVQLLATLVRQLTRTPGEGAMSDYESKLAQMTLPSRTDTPEGRREALAGLRELISGIRSGYEEMNVGPSQPSPITPSSTKPGGFKFLGFE